MKPTRIISQRDLTTRSTGEVVRRLIFIPYVLAGPAGAVAIALGINRQQDLPIAAGVAALVLAVTLHLTRKRWGARVVTEELKTSIAFKPKRVPKDSEE